LVVELAGRLIGEAACLLRRRWARHVPS
jgi:hypothetical protein